MWRPVREVRHNLPAERDAFVGRIAELRALAARLDAGARLLTVLGPGGAGFKLAMRSLDVFRASVAAAALGLARRALDEALDRATSRSMFGGTLADFQLTQAALAEMATGIDASALLRVDVVDHGHGFEPGAAGRESLGGWGLTLVEGLADRWGVLHDGETRVWFEMAM